MTTMNFNTANNTFRQLMGNGLSYHVPPFQRDYSWSEDEWDDLWHDMVDLFGPDSENSHYMGYLVLQSPDSKRFDIIDGQQRLTTISIIILAALAHLNDLIEGNHEADNNRQRGQQLRNSYIGYLDPVSLVSRSKLELNRHNNRFYQNYLVPLETLPQRNLNSSEHLLRKAFKWFADKMKDRFGYHDNSGKNLTAFLDSLVDRLFFTVITVTNELNAFRVFETLNARGVRLSATDLLKNYLFAVISSSNPHETELTALEDRWERIVGLLGSENFPEFLRVFWNSRNRLVRKSDLFKTIKKKVTTRDAAFELLRLLDHSAAIYASLRDSHDSVWSRDEKDALEQLTMFNVRQPLAMLMAAYSQFFDSDRKSFTRILKAISILSLRYNVICNLQTNEQEGVYNDIARKISDGIFTQYTDIVAALGKLYPDDTVFKAAFSEKEMRTTNSRNRKVLRYILFELEKQQSGQDFDFESLKYDIEHILPEHPSSEWTEYIEEARQERLIYRIGNMTMLERPENRNLGNAIYTEKIKAYAQSDFVITRAVAEHYDIWDENKIESRQQRLADVASAIWRIDVD